MLDLDNWPFRIWGVLVISPLRLLSEHTVRLSFSPAGLKEMRLPNLAFTKRLSVRLGALGTMVASGVIAGAQTYWSPGDDSQNEKTEVAVVQEKLDEPLQPIPDAAAQEDTSDAQPFLHEDSFPSPPVLPAGGTLHDGMVQPAVAVNVPSPHDTVIRGNDDSPIVQTAGETPLAPPEPTFSQGDSIYSSTPPSPAFEAPSDQSDGASPTLAPTPALANGVPDAAATTLPDFQPPQQAFEPPTFDPPASFAPSAQPEPAPTPADATRSAGVPPASPASEPRALQPSGFGDQPAASVIAPIPTAQSEPRTFDPPATAYDASPSGDFGPSQTGSMVQPASTASAAGSNVQGDGVPGSEQTDGLQTPSLSIEKLAAEEIQVGKETTFRTRIRNVGTVVAHDLVVMDRIPRGTQLVNAVPEFTRSPDGQLMWQLDMLKPGDEIEIAMRVMPTSEGEIGSVAQVLFATPASVRTVCTRPQLAVNHSGQPTVLIGESVTFDITVSNPGTGAATGVVLEENVPEGLTHAAGRELQRDVGTLRPGDSRRLQLTLTADKAGVVEQLLLVRGDGNLLARDTIRLEIIAPQLQVSVTGPKLRYLDRPATYEVAVANPGTATAREVELVTYLTKGLKFIDADHKGQYEPANHAVYWSLAELPAKATGVAKMTLLPIETGQQTINSEARAELGLQHASEKVVTVESLAELQFTVADLADPIEVGTETTYEITLSNSGSSAATDIQLAIGIPAGMQPLGGDGPTRVSVQADQLKIERLARLGSGETVTYRIKMLGRQAGPQRIQVQLITAETPVPVNKEEITRVYADN